MSEKPFQTPLAIHREAFDRVAAGLRVAAAGLDKLRKAYATAERQGLNSADMHRRVTAAIGEFVWEWPWFEQCADHFASAGLLPLMWQQEGLSNPVRWAEIPHNVRVRLLTATLNTTVWSVRDIKDAAQMIREAPHHHMTVSIGDKRCAATAAMVERFRPQVERGDYSALPPYFPGDQSSLELGRRRR
jgi:hypothetical protein